MLLIAGNHDTPRSSETGGILQLFAQLGLSVVDREAAAQLPFPKLAICRCLASAGCSRGQTRPELKPDPAGCEVQRAW